MRNKKAFFFCVLSLIAAVVLFLAGQNDYRRGDRFLQGMIMTVKSGIGGTQAGAMLDAEKPVYSFAVWTELSKESVCAVDRGNFVDAAVMAVCGSSECVLSFGRNLTMDDTEGCIVGKGLAEKLFGGRRVEGQRIEWRGRHWTVRGVVEEPSELLMVQTYGMEEEIQYDKISVRLSAGGSRRGEGEKFAACYGIDARAVRWDYLYTYHWIAEMIPGKWSDFDSWRRNLKEYREGRELAVSTGRSLIETAGLRYVRRGYIFICLGVIFGVCSEIAFCRSNIYNEKNIF